MHVHVTTFKSSTEGNTTNKYIHMITVMMTTKYNLLTIYTHILLACKDGLVVTTVTPWTTDGTTIDWAVGKEVRKL